MVSCKLALEADKMDFYKFRHKLTYFNCLIAAETWAKKFPWIRKKWYQKS